MFQAVIAWDLNKTVCAAFSFSSLGTDPKTYSASTIEHVREKIPYTPSKVKFEDSNIQSLAMIADQHDCETVAKVPIECIDLTGDSDDGIDHHHDCQGHDGHNSAQEDGKFDIFEESVDQFELEWLKEQKEEPGEEDSEKSQEVIVSGDTSCQALNSSNLDKSHGSRGIPLQKTTLQGLSPAERIILRLKQRRKKSSRKGCKRHFEKAGENSGHRGKQPSSDVLSSSDEENHAVPKGVNRMDGFTLAQSRAAPARIGLNQSVDSPAVSADALPRLSFPGEPTQGSACRMGLNVLPKIHKRRYRFKDRRPAREIPTGIRNQSALVRASHSLHTNPFDNAKFCCKSGCHSMVNASYAVAQYRRFLSMDRADRKRALRLMFNREMNQFWFDGHPVCSRFMTTLSFSNQLQSAVKGTLKSRASASALACPREVKTLSKKDQIMLYLKDVAGTLGDALPTKKQFNLPLLSKKQVYDRFLKSIVVEPDVEPVSFSYFCDVWKKQCSEFKTHRNHGFTVCSICEKLRSHMASCESTAMQATIRAQMDAHYKHIAAERRGYAERIDLSKKFPGKYISVIVDGADQKGYGLPHFVFNTKDDKGHKMKVKCVGVLQHGLQKHLSLFALTEEFESGANHILEAMHRVLQKRKDTVGSLPEVLFVQADNCTRENKNKYFMGYCEMLVANGVFLEVQVSFLPIGHTHTDIDQAFSAVANRLRLFDAVTMESLIKELSSCYKPLAEAEVMDKVANFSGLCDISRCLRTIPGISQYRFFRFVRRAVPESSRDELMNGTFHATTCDVKVQLTDEWTPLDSSSERMGFLRDVPSLQETPDTDTNPPENVLEVNKHLESVEERIGSEANMESLLRLKENVYSRRIESFHWDVTNCFEVNGDYIRARNAEMGCESRLLTSAHHSSSENLGYPLNAFIAVRTESGCTDPFWIARTLQVAKKDKGGITLELKVRWYEAKPGSQDAFSAKYRMATFVKESQQQFFDDLVDVRSIVCQFEGLTQSGSLHIRTQKAIRQCLNMD